MVYAIRVNRKEDRVEALPVRRFHIACWPRVATTRIPADAGNFGLIDARVVKADRSHLPNATGICPACDRGLASGRSAWRSSAMPL